MTADDRKNLKALANQLDGMGAAGWSGAAASADLIRAALARIDALERDRAMMHADRIHDAAEIDRLRAEVADLRARAIPSWMVGSTLEIRSFANRGSALMHFIEWIWPGRVRLSQSGNDGTTQTEHPTLAAAFDAASRETP